MKRKTDVSLIEYMRSLGAQVTELAPEEESALLSGWYDAYCAKLRSETGKPVYRGFRWHVFSGNYYPSQEGAEAESSYGKEKVHQVFVIPEEGEKEAGFSSDRMPPVEIALLKRDFQVFPKNLAWTMSFTHEYGWLGPYFAYHAEYEKLNKKNREAFDRASLS